MGVRRPALKSLGGRPSKDHMSGMSEQKKPEPAPAAGPTPKKPAISQPDGEVGGPKGPEPTRFGDWENKGRCSDF